MSKLRSLIILSSSFMALSSLPSFAGLFDLPKLGTMACSGKTPCYDDPNTCVTQTIFDRCIKNCLLKNKDPKKAQEVAAKLFSCPQEMIEHSSLKNDIESSSFYGQNHEEMGQEMPEGMPMSEDTPSMPPHDTHEDMPIDSGNMLSPQNNPAALDDQMGMNEHEPHQVDSPSGPMAPGMGGKMNEHLPFVPSSLASSDDLPGQVMHKDSMDDGIDDGLNFREAFNNTIVGGLLNN